MTILCADLRAHEGMGSHPTIINCSTCSTAHTGHLTGHQDAHLVFGPETSNWYNFLVGHIIVVNVAHATPSVIDLLCKRLGGRRENLCHQVDAISSMVGIVISRPGVAEETCVMRMWRCLED